MWEVVTEAPEFAVPRCATWTPWAVKQGCKLWIQAPGTRLGETAGQSRCTTVLRFPKRRPWSPLVPVIPQWQDMRREKGLFVDVTDVTEVRVSK